MNRRTCLAVAAAAAILLTAVLPFPFGASSARADEPEITFQFPEDGAVIAEPPLVLQMCFKEPVDVRDLPPLDEGDFDFTLTRPDGINLGMRIVFQPDGYGVTIIPGTAENEPPEGEWTWEYRVVDPESGDPLDGTVHFTTNAETGEEILQPTPQTCLAEGATNQPTVIIGGTGSPDTESPGGGNSENGDDDPGVLTLALITIGIAAAGAIVAVIAFFIRRRVGYEPHAPSDGSDTGDDHP